MEEGTEKERAPNDFKGTEITAAVVITATDHKINTVLIQFPLGSVDKVGIAHA